MRKAKHRKIKSIRKAIPIFETLEDRQLYSVVSVTPGNFAAAINSSSPGDTISFGAGTYNFANRMLLPGNRIYQGNGQATITGPDSSTASMDFDTVTGVEVTGFTFTGTFLQVHDCQVNIHGNTFENTGGYGVYGDGFTNSHIDDNTFSGQTNTSVMIYPGNNNTIDGNTFNNIEEAIHTIGGSYNDYSHNVINYCSRNGIEVQGGQGMTNLTVDDNWIGNWNPNGNKQPDGTCSHMAISFATGSNPNGGAVTNQGENNTISGNTLLLNGSPGQTAPEGGNYALTGIELMGQQNINVTDNYCAGASMFIMNGTSNNAGNSSGNTLIVSERDLPDSCPWQITPLSGTDHVYAWNASNAPAAPSVAATVGASVSTGTTSTSSPAPTVAAPAPTQSIPAGITATANGQSGQITVNAPAGATLGIYASTLDPSTAVNLGAISGTSATIGGIPADWQVTVTVTTGGTTYTLPSVEVTNSTIADTGPFNPALVSAVVSPVVSAPAPVVTAIAPTIPAGVTATANGQPGQVTVTAPAGSTLGIYASTMAPSSAVNLGTISGSSATIGGIPGDWQVTVTVTTGGTTYTLPSVEVVNSTIPDTGPFNPALVSAVVAPVTTTSTPTPVTTTPASTIPAGITATANGQPGQIAVTAPAGSTLEIYTNTGVDLGTMSGTSATIDGIPQDWWVTVTVTTNGTTYSLPSLEVVTSTVPNTGAFNPTLVQAVVAPVTSAPAPVVTTPAITTPVTAPASTIPAGITATANGQPGQIAVTAPAGSTVEIYTNSGVNLGTMSGTSATIDGIPQNWWVTVTVTTDGTTYSLPSLEVVNSAIPNTGAFNPVLVAATPMISGVSSTAGVSTGAVAAATNFVATSPSSSEVDLSWTDNTNGQATYVLQRRATYGSTGFQTIATVAAGVNSYNDVHVNANWEYDYRLVGVLSGVASPTVAAHVRVQNGSASTTPVTVTAPAAPTVLLGASPNSTAVDLSWVDNTGGTATYVLARRATTGTTGYQVIATLAAGTTSFTDTNVSANSQYDYYLAAVVPGAVSSAATVHVQVQPMLSLPLADAA